MKKGFTLIELLAVIVILAIIALIATPIILGIIEDAKKGSAEASANGYIDAVEYKLARDEMKGIKTGSGVYDVTELDIDLDGEKPIFGEVTIEKSNVISAKLCISGYNIVYDKGKVKAKGICSKDVENSEEAEIINLPKVGDYIKMTPTLTSFTTDINYTGYTESQMINPSELNLWRVIKVNDDGTLELVSEYVSNDSIYFKGKTGYKNFVGYLNLLSSKYENVKYTSGSRHMGYNGQTEFLTNTESTIDLDKSTPIWRNSTINNNNEVQGGGDILYENDLNLVKTAIGTLDGKLALGGKATYWIASRFYEYNSNWYYSGRVINLNEEVKSYAVYKYNIVFSDLSYAFNIRPIVILKSGIDYKEAEGTFENPYVLE